MNMARPGRKSDKFELPDGTLDERLGVVLDTWPEVRARFSSNKLISAQMAPFWDPRGGKGPDQSTVSTKLNNNSEVTNKFVEALHAALPVSTANVDKWQLKMEEFRQFVVSERAADPRILFERIAADSIKLEIGHRDLLLGLGRKPRRRQKLEIGSSQHLTVTLPIEGYLTVINFGPDVYGQPEYLWLDPLLGTSGRRLCIERLVIPETEDGLPVDGPASVYSLIAINTTLPIDMLAICSLSAVPNEAHALLEREARHLFSLVQSRPHSERAVSILEYKVINSQERSESAGP
jgi:hypothetical protein